MWRHSSVSAGWGWLMRKPGPRHLVVDLDLELGAARPARVLSASETAAERSVNPSAPPYAVLLHYRLSPFFQNSGGGPLLAPL